MPEAEDPEVTVNSSPCSVSVDTTTTTEPHEGHAKEVKVRHRCLMLTCLYFISAMLAAELETSAALLITQSADGYFCIVVCSDVCVSLQSSGRTTVTCCLLCLPYAAFMLACRTAHFPTDITYVVVMVYVVYTALTGFHKLYHRSITSKCSGVSVQPCLISHAPFYIHHQSCSQYENANATQTSRACISHMSIRVSFGSALS